MIDTAKKAATAGNENARAEIIEIRVFVQPALSRRSFTIRVNPAPPVRTASDNT